MKLYFRSITPKDPWYSEVQRLYEASFPLNERRPFSALFTDFHGEGKIMAAMTGGQISGMVVLLSHKEITHILYIAVEENLRSFGYGSRMLELIREQYPGQKIVADLERPKESAPNESQRERRIAFYQKNGYILTEINYCWEGEDYCIVSNGGDVTKKEFGDFWKYFYSNG